MKNFKTSLHVLLSFVSILGFLGGWATLAHSRKPIQNTSGNPATQALDPLPPLAPLPAMGSTSSNSSAGLLSIAPQQQQPSRLRSSRPFLTTSGS